MYKDYHVSAIIAAAGMSNRMGSKINKQFIAIDNKPILAHTIGKFEECRYIDEIIVVCKEEEVEYCRKEIVRKYGFKKVTTIIRGGKERQDSIYNALFALNDNTDIVLTHDGARPFIKVKSIEDGIKGVIEFGACVIGVPVTDTIKVVSDSKEVNYTPKRSLLWAAQTPQCFWSHLIKEAYEKAKEEDFLCTDDSSLIERINHPITMIMGSYDNIKITTPEDLIFAESLARDMDSVYLRREFLTR